MELTGTTTGFGLGHMAVPMECMGLSMKFLVPAGKGGQLGADGSDYGLHDSLKDTGPVLGAGADRTGASFVPLIWSMATLEKALQGPSELENLQEEISTREISLLILPGRC